MELTDPIVLSAAEVKRVHGSIAESKRQLGELVAEVGPTLCWQDKDRLWQHLLSRHEAFAIEDRHRGETDVVEMAI